MTKTPQITIIDYGLGNLNSVVRAVTAAGGNGVISSDPSDMARAEKLILPGVGAFQAGMDGLRERKLIEPLIEQVENGKHLLGLCLGMQLLFEIGEEFGEHLGLGLIPGLVKKLQPIEKDTKIPHIGWNSVICPKHKTWDGTILENIQEGEMVYFVHSYVPVPKIPEDCLAETRYGGALFCSVVSKHHVHGTQFHPEKSGEVGQKILRAFLRL